MTSKYFYIQRAADAILRGSELSDAEQAVMKRDREFEEQVMEEVRRQKLSTCAQAHTARDRRDGPFGSLAC